MVLGRLLKVELVARESEQSESSVLVLLDHGVEVGVLLGVGAESSYVDDKKNLAPVLRKISELTLQCLHLEVVDGLVDCGALAPPGGLVDHFRTWLRGGNGCQCESDC